MCEKCAALEKRIVRLEAKTKIDTSAEAVIADALVEKFIDLVDAALYPWFERVRGYGFGASIESRVLAKLIEKHPTFAEFHASLRKRFYASQHKQHSSPRLDGDKESLEISKIGKVAECTDS